MASVFRGDDPPYPPEPFLQIVRGEAGPEEIAALVATLTAIAAVDEAIAAHPEVAAKVRGGTVQAAGGLVGAVLRATRGQADAARVRELILQRLSG